GGQAGTVVGQDWRSGSKVERSARTRRVAAGAERDEPSGARYPTFSRRSTVIEPGHENGPAVSEGRSCDQPYRYSLPIAHRGAETRVTSWGTVGEPLSRRSRNLNSGGREDPRDQKRRSAPAPDPRAPSPP